MRVISTLIEGAAAKGLIRPETYTTFGSIYDKIQALLKTEHDFNS